MRFIQGVIFLFFFSAVLHCEEDLCAKDAILGDLPPCESVEDVSLSYVEKSFPNLIHNCVCVISGAYIDRAVDVTLPGPATLCLERQYRSGKVKGGLGIGWGFVNFDTLGSNNVFIELGFCNLQRVAYEKHKSHYYITSLNGYTNLSRGIPSARTNIKNQTIEELKDKIIVHTPNEEDREFVYHNSVMQIQRWREVSRFNKAHNGFEFNRGHTLSKLTKIEAKNRSTERVFSQLIFTDLDHHAFQVNASEDTWVKYSFRKNRHDEHLLSSVEKSGGYIEKYTYHEDKLVRKELPEGRFLEVEYHREDDKDHSGKVKALYRPGNFGESARKIYGFEYLKNNTFVTDAEGNVAQYIHDSKGRLSQISTYCKKEGHRPELYRIEKFFFGHGDDEGNLIAKVLYDRDKNELEGLSLTYDHKGNVTHKTLFGSLTGKEHHHPFSIDDAGHFIKNGRECEEVSYTYTHHNRVASEVHENGLRIEYQYCHPDLISGKFTYEKDSLKKREFFHYDEYGCLIYKSWDDGTAKEENDLSHVTEKHVTRIEMRNSVPFGMPWKTTEYAIDLSNHTEILLHWKEEDFSKEGKLLSSKLFGADGNLYESHTYTYDVLGHLIQEIDPLGNEIRREVDQNGNILKEITSEYTLENSYDFSNQLILQVRRTNQGESLSTSFAYNDMGKKIRMIDPYGQETTYEYDGVGRLKKTTTPEVMTEKGEWVRPIERIHYDIADRPVCITDKMGNKTKTKFTIRGNPTEIITSEGSEEHFVYDLGKLVEKTEKDGTKKRIVRDYLGRVLKETTFDTHGHECFSVKNTYNAFHLLSSRDSEGRETLYSYDLAGRLSSIQKGEAITQYSYDGIGRLSLMKEKVDTSTWRTTYKKYDALSRQIEERIESASGELLHLDRFEFDSFGNKIYAQNGPSTYRTTYNGFGLPTTITDGLGNTTHIVYDFAYVNPHGQRVLRKETTDPNGFITEEIHDTHGRCVSTCRKSPFGEIIAYKECLYNLLGALCDVKNTCYVPGSQDTSFTQRRYEYDREGHLTKEILLGEEERVTHYEYNAYGQKTKKIKPDGVEIVYSYDPKGRLDHLTSSDHTVDYRYIYNNDDKCVESIDEIHGKTTQITYDLEGRVIQEKLANDLKVSYTYDCGGRTRQVILPDSTSIEYVYDCLNLKEIHRVKEGKRAYSHIEEAHNLCGQPTHAILPFEHHAFMSYDLLGRKTSLNTFTFSQGIPEGGFDPAGNLKTLITQGETTSYSYDGNYQLTEEKDSHYIHDSLGNRRMKNGEIYRTNAFNQLISKGSSTYTYDPSGNLICKSEAGKETHYGYDALDRMTHITTEGKTTSYLYDANHRRISQQCLGKEQSFLYMGEEEIGLYEKGVPLQLKVLGKGKRHPAIAMEIQGKTYIPIEDLVGNVVQLCSLDWDIIQTFEYNAFGELTITQGESLPLAPWLFSNKRLDDSGLYYFGLRFYDPTMGRWLSSDPSGFEDGENLYTYVRNNPLTHFDERGLFTWDDVCTAADNTCDFICNAAHATYDFCCTAADTTYDFFYKAGASFIDFSPPQVYCTNDLINPATNEHYNFSNPSEGELVYTPGILNTKADCDHTLIYLSEKTGWNVTGVFSHTRGFLGDAIVYLAELCGHRSSGSLALQRTLESYASEKPVILIAHSEGCVASRNALMSLNQSLSKQIYYLAICPGAYTSSKYCQEVTHLCSLSDPVTYIDYMGRIRCHDTIIELQRHEDAFFFDHTIISPTFADPIRKAVDIYFSHITGSVT